MKLGMRASESTKAKMRIAWDYEKHFPAEPKRNMERLGSQNHFYGKNMSKENSPRWKGEDVSPFQKQARRIAERLYGLNTCQNKDIHHIDGNSENNTEENLTPLSRADHKSIHFQEKRISYLSALAWS